jgi:hypothetical protein
MSKVAMDAAAVKCEGSIKHPDRLLAQAGRYAASRRDQAQSVPTSSTVPRKANGKSIFLLRGLPSFAAFGVAPRLGHATRGGWWRRECRIRRQ